MLEVGSGLGSSILGPDQGREGSGAFSWVLVCDVLSLEALITDCTIKKAKKKKRGEEGRLAAKPS